MPKTNSLFYVMKTFVCLLDIHVYFLAIEDLGERVTLSFVQSSRLVMLRFYSGLWCFQDPI